MPLFQHDVAILAAANIPTLCGVDEAGRGPLTGPVFAAAVTLPLDEADILHVKLKYITDSKKLTAKRRDSLFEEIKEVAAAWSIAQASVSEIEEMNILRAALLAMRRAVAGLQVTPALALIDGNACPGSGLPERAIVGGDGLSASVAAASVLAKVARDRYMLEIAARWPQYRFERHKGYGTGLHYEMLDRYGPCDAHRESFLRKWRAGRHERGE